MKDRIIAGVLGITLGTFGLHKFYLGKKKRGILYLLFSWTGIPAVVGLIEGILYLVNSEEEFNLKYNKQAMLDPANAEIAAPTKKLDMAKVKEELQLLAEWKERGIINEEDFKRRSQQIIQGKSNFK